MNTFIGEFLYSVPVFALAFARIVSVIVLLPGPGEAAAPPAAKIGIAACITFLLMPSLGEVSPADWQDASIFTLAAVTEVVTGLWFGLLVRLLVLALPIAGQIIGYLVGLSSVLQPDPELGSQTSALGRLLDLAAPLLILTSGLYRIPLRALGGLFVLVPPGHLLPSADSLKVMVDHVSVAFDLALQFASPFVAVCVIWQIAMGQVARVVARMQIYFISMPGQILVGLTVLALTADAIAAAWRYNAEALLLAMPGGS